MLHHRQALWSLFNPRSTGDVDTGLLWGVLGSSWVSIEMGSITESGHFEQQSSTLLWQTKMHTDGRMTVGGRSRLPWELRVNVTSANSMLRLRQGNRLQILCPMYCQDISDFHSWNANIGAKTRFVTNAAPPRSTFFSDGQGFSQILCGQDLGGHAGERDSL